MATNMVLTYLHLLDPENPTDIWMNGEFCSLRWAQGTDGSDALVGVNLGGAENAMAGQRWEALGFPWGFEG